MSPSVPVGSVNGSDPFNLPVPVNLPLRSPGNGLVSLALSRDFSWSRDMVHLIGHSQDWSHGSHLPSPFPVREYWLLSQGVP